MRSSSTLRRRLLARDAQVAVVGQGYVGLSLACAAAEAGFEVTGIDVDADRVDALAAGELVVPGVDEASFRSGVATGRLGFTADGAALADQRRDLHLRAHPGPRPHPRPVLCRAGLPGRGPAPGRGAAGGAGVEHLPGDDHDLVAPLLEASGQRVGRDFLLAYSPERIDPGNAEFTFGNTPRIVGGTTAEATAVAALFYEQMIEKVVTVSSARAAELAKLLENTFRHVNIALVNEMAMVCHELGIDVWEVIEAAATKPFGFMAFTPGPGSAGTASPSTPPTWPGRCVATSATSSASWSRPRTSTPTCRAGWRPGSARP